MCVYFGADCLAFQLASLEADSTIHLWVRARSICLLYSELAVCLLAGQRIYCCICFISHVFVKPVQLHLKVDTLKTTKRWLLT